MTTDVTGRSTGPSADARTRIEDLYSAYLWALDTQDVELYLQAFWPEAVFRETQLDGSVKTWTGIEEIRALTESHFGGYHGHQHREANRLYAPGDNPAQWRARAYYFTSHRDDATDVAEFFSTGHTRDRIEERDGEWRFVERAVSRWAGEISHPFRDDA